MITIDQLLESVDLDFEPRFVTKDQNGMVWLWEKKPHTIENWWDNTLSLKEIGGKIKISEFENKPWSECIYEVPRKTTGKIEKFTYEDFEYVSNVYGATEKVMGASCLDKLNLLVDAVNELKGAKNE